MTLQIDIKKKLAAFDLEIALEAEAETIGFLGESGCGKSMTMRCIAGIETPDEGKIIVNGETYFDSAAKINLKPQQRKTALLFQNYMLFPHFTVEANIAAGIDKSVSADERNRIVQHELDRFSLHGFEKRYPMQLSGGQQQRVSIGRALMNAPAVVLADEPTGNLDSANSQEIVELLKLSNQKYNQTLIVITHDENIALQADRIIAIEDGKIVRDEVIRK